MRSSPEYRITHKGRIGRRRTRRPSSPHVLVSRSATLRSPHPPAPTLPTRRLPDARRDALVVSPALPTPRRRSFPVRYGIIALSGGLLVLASAASVPLGPAARTPGRELLTVVAGAFGLLLSLVAAMPLSRPQASSPRRLWRSRLLLSVAVICAIGTLVTFAGGAYTVLNAPASESYVTDIVSFTHMNAQLAMNGRNPYTSDAAFTQALALFPNASGTPMRGTVFGTGYDHPDPSTIYRVQRAYVASPSEFSDAFDPRTLHSYPALSFLLYVPLLWAGGGNILVLHALVYWLLFAWLVWLTPIGWRHWGALAALGAMSTVAASLLVSDEVVPIALVLAAWHFRDRRWLFSILLGLACAYKQYAWFFVPLLGVEVVIAYGWREALRRAAIGLGAFMAPNLPYLIASPGPWFMSLWLPMSEPLFSMGVGVIALSMGHIIPYAAPLFYAILEVAALGAAIWAYVRWRRNIGDAVLILALLPLFFAFRSLADYFAFVPWLALYAAHRLYAPAGGDPSSPLARLTPADLRRQLTTVTSGLVARVRPLRVAGE